MDNYFGDWFRSQSWTLVGISNAPDYSAKRCPTLTWPADLRTLVGRCRNNPVAGIMTKIMETRAPRIARAAEADFTGQFDKGRAHRRLARPATTFRKEEAGTVGIAAETITARSVALQSTFCC